MDEGRQTGEEGRSMWTRNSLYTLRPRQRNVDETAETLRQDPTPPPDPSPAEARTSAPATTSRNSRVAPKLRDNCRKVAPGAKTRPDFDQGWSAIGQSQPDSGNKWPNSRIRRICSRSAKISPKLAKFGRNLTTAGAQQFGKHFSSFVLWTFQRVFFGRVAAGSRRHQARNTSRPASLTTTLHSVQKQARAQKQKQGR